MRSLPISVYLEAQRKKQDLELVEQGEKELREIRSKVPEEVIESARSIAYKSGYEAGQQQSRASILAESEAAGKTVNHLDDVERKLRLFESALKRDLAKYRRDLEYNLLTILRSLIDESMAARHNIQLKQAVRRLLDAAGSARITVTADRETINMLKSWFEEQPSDLSFIESEQTSDVMIVSDQTVISSKLRVWRQTINDLFEADMKAIK